MNAIAKNILVNAAKSTNQDIEQTLILAARSLTHQQIFQVKNLMEKNVVIDHKSVNEWF